MSEHAIVQIVGEIVCGVIGIVGIVLIYLIGKK